MSLYYPIFKGAGELAERHYPLHLVTGDCIIHVLTDQGMCMQMCMQSRLIRTGWQVKTIFTIKVSLGPPECVGPLFWFPEITEILCDLGSSRQDQLPQQWTMLNKPKSKKTGEVGTFKQRAARHEKTDIQCHWSFCVDLSASTPTCPESHPPCGVVCLVPQTFNWPVLNHQQFVIEWTNSWQG